MSALSKVFVALLVVCSLMLSAGVVVFVNKTEDAQKEKTTAVLAAKAAEARKAVADAEAISAREAAAKAIASAQERSATLETEIKTKALEISKRDADIAALRNEGAQRTIVLTATGDALKAAEAQKAKQDAQLADLRATADKLTKEKSELNQSLSDNIARLEVMTREWNYTKEQLAQLSNQSEKLIKQVKDLGGNPNVEVTGVKNGAPPINGVVREVRKLEDNHQWATISVGAADQVVKGMEFKVIDRENGHFMGILKVETVQPNEATGVMSGPMVNDVKAGNEVRTQL